MRALVVSCLALLLGGCGFLDQIVFNSTGLPSNKVYLNRADVISVSAREAHRYACADQPLLCVQHGVTFECRCP